MKLARFELSQFLAEDQLSFQLMGYENLNLSSKEIEAQNHVVALLLDEKKLGENCALCCTNRSTIAENSRTCFTNR